MIKFNETYTIQNGDIVTFSEGKKGSISGTYNGGTLTGTLEGNLLKATYHNTKVNAVGLMEITFHENGFIGKWKQGLEPGPMKGKWNGLLSGAGEDTEKRKVEQLEFVVIQENGGIEELSFNISASEITPLILNKNITSEDYSNILNNKDIIEACCAVIEEKDSWLIENSHDFVLRLNAVDEEKLDFLWNADFDNLADQERLKIFFNKENETLTSDDYEELFEEFLQDSICSLDYVKNINN